MKRWQWWVLACAMGLFCYDGARGQSAVDLRLAAANDPLYKAQGGKLNADSWTYYFDRVPNAAIMPFENGLLEHTPTLLTPEQYLEKRTVILRIVAAAIGCLQFPASWGNNLSSGSGFGSVSVEGATTVYVDLSWTFQQAAPPTSAGDCPLVTGSQVLARDENYAYICAPKPGGGGFRWARIPLQFMW